MKKAAGPSILCSVILFAVAVIAEAQQAKKVSRIGYLASADPARESTRAEAIRLALRELGYIEGQNIAIEYRYAEGNNDRLPELAADLVRLKLDLIVVSGALAAVATKAATSTIPIMTTAGGDFQISNSVESSGMAVGFSDAHLPVFFFSASAKASLTTA